MQLSVAIATRSAGGKWTANWSKIGEQLQKEWLPWSEREGWRLRISGMCPHACWKERRLVNWRGLEGDSTRALIRDAPEADTLNPGSSFAFVGEKGWLGKELQPQPCERFPRSSHHGVPRCRRSPTRIQRYSRNCICLVVRPNTLHRHCTVPISPRLYKRNNEMHLSQKDTSTARRAPSLAFLTSVPPTAQTPTSRISQQTVDHEPQRSLSSLIRSTPSPIHGPVIAT